MERVLSQRFQVSGKIEKKDRDIDRRLAVFISQSQRLRVAKATVILAKDRCAEWFDDMRELFVKISFRRDRRDATGHGVVIWVVTEGGLSLGAQKRSEAGLFGKAEQHGV